MSELPNGWADTTLGEVVDYAVTQKAEPTEIRPNDWILELEDIEKDSSKLLSRHTFEERQSKSTKNRFSKGDVLYGKLRPYLNKVLIADADGYCTTEIIPIKPNESVDGRFVFYALKRKEFLDYVQEIAHGLNMPRLGTEQGRNAPFRLAPLNEQKRIADKLDRLLARVDAAKARLDKIPPLLKRLRQAILAAATTGKLTEEWREERGVGELKEIPIEGILADKKSGMRRGPFGSAIKKSFFVPVGYKVYEQKNAIHDDPNLGEYFIDEEKFAELANFAVKGGDFIASCAGTIGRISLLPDDCQPGVINQALVRIRTNSEMILDQFFLYLFRSPDFQKKIIDSSRGGAMQNMASISEIKALEIFLPELDEQKEIVRRVEELFAIADRIEAQYRTARARVDRLTQSMLAKAFRGELVPQDPTDEPAAALLERIRTQRSEAPMAKRSKGQRK